MGGTCASIKTEAHKSRLLTHKREQFNKLINNNQEVALDTDQGHKTMKKMITCMIALLAALAINMNAEPAVAPAPASSVSTHTDIVKARHTDTYNVYFVGGVEAEVAVIGDGDTDLDLYIYDENGNLIVSDTDSTDDCYVSWTPKWSGYFKIKIKNLGYVSNCYTLLTN